MYSSPPKEKQLVSWSYVMAGAVIIFVSIPFALAIQQWICRQLGREAFFYLVMGLIIVSLAGASVCFYRLPSVSLRNYVWLFVVGVVFAGYTVELRGIPAESIHFIEYGFLGVLVYRALTHRIKDVSIYLAAAVFCGIIGMIDELIQWIVPKRFGDFNDIWLNFFSGSLVQVGIAKGLNPPVISGRPTRSSIRLLCRFTMAGVLLFCFFLLNTPIRIAWYTEKFPFLHSLSQNGDVMIEYGFLYNDPEIGVFRSRLSPRKLNKIDKEQGKDMAEILNQFQGGTKYDDFLKSYTPVADPFLCEARAHLFLRDVSFSVSEEYEDDRVEFARLLTIAFRENELLEKYFSNTLNYSGYVWSADNFALARKHLLHDEVYESHVSRHLFTLFREVHAIWLFSLLEIGLLLVYCYLGRSKSAYSSL